ALMPNHFHFLVKQRSSDGINRFLRSLATKYSMYFNKKYVRVGSLFQGVYKAVLVETEGQLLHLTRYIHKNPRSGSTQPTSLPEYLGVRRTPWVKPGEILNFFSKTNSNDSYQSFLNESADWSLIADYMVDVDSQGETLRG
ncbi:transposase, partial [Patescibacteria group bacterium]|nr:transposase [Patescibacteria group bacterium]